MAILVALMILILPVVLVAAVVDTLRVARRQGSFPDVSFTYRAYGA